MKEKTNAEAAPTLARALLQAQKAVQAIGKDGRNDRQGYDYTRAETIIGVCSTALNNAGLIVRRLSYSVGDWVEQALTTPRGPSVQLVAPVRMVFRITHAETGEHEDYAVDYPAVQQPGRPADKAVSGALTASLGYFLRDLLAVSRGHDAYDIDARHEPSAPDPLEPTPPSHVPQPQRAGTPIEGLQAWLAVAQTATVEHFERAMTCLGIEPRRVDAWRTTEKQPTVADLGPADRLALIRGMLPGHAERRAFDQWAGATPPRKAGRRTAA